MSERFCDLLRWQPGTKLADVDPRATPGFEGDKDEGVVATQALLEGLAELQIRLWAAKTKGLLIVLQGRDASGKDGAVRHVIGAMSPFGFAIASYKAPTEIEAGHDFLWRIHQRVPARGEMVVFNRSHYEDVLIRRVRGFDTEDRWRPRYAHIRAFEDLIAGDGDVVIVKCALHISKDEQEERFRARLEDPTKVWKFNPGDLDDRRHWEDYDRAYEDALDETDADHAPWYLIPADRKWYRDLAIAHVVSETLSGLGLEYPDVDFDPAAIEIP